MIKLNLLKITIVIVIVVLNWSCSKTDSTATPTPQPESVQVVWKNDLAVKINPAIGRNYMPAVDENNNIYVLMNNLETDGWVMQAFNVSGTLLWTENSSSENAIRQIPTYYEGRLYFATHSKIICLDASTGNLLWDLNPADSVETTTDIVISNHQLVTVFSGFTAEHSYVAAIDPTTGDISAFKALGSRGQIFKLAAVGSYFYVCYNNLYKYQNNTGTIDLEWMQTLPGNIDANDETYRILYGDMVIDPNNDNVYLTYSNPTDYGTDVLIAYDLSGNMLWKKDGVSATHLSVDFDNNLYVSNSDLIKYNGNNGAEIWTATPPSETMGMGNEIDAITHGQNGVMYAGDVYGVYGIDANNQNQFQAFPNSIAGAQTPLTYATLLSNGNVVVLGMAKDENSSAQIYCIKEESEGVKPNIWAKWGANAANTFNLYE